MTEPLTALVVMSPERSCELTPCLAGLAARVVTAATCGEAAVRMRLEADIRVVLTDLSLPDGSWCDVLTQAGDLQPAAEVVVCSRLADERLWTQVLEAGGFDVLSEPYYDAEVRRVFRAAALGRHHLAAAV